MFNRRVRFTVELDLDGLPGFNHNTQDFADHTRYDLAQSIPWYHPTVSEAVVIESTPSDGGE